MTLEQFASIHAPALEHDEVRHNLILGILAFVLSRPGGAKLETWTLGAPGACAIMAPGRPIILGDVRRDECHALATLTRDHDVAGVVGLEGAATWFVERAVELGASFAAPMPQRLHVLRAAPRYPGVAGQSRRVTAADAPRFADWFEAFCREAIPDDPVPPRADLEARAASGEFTFWEIDGEPVAMAGIVRRSRTTGTIAAVYTPLSMRGRGYGGSATAAVAERIFAEGRTAVCLYTDLRNPASNRCYEKLGFTPVCNGAHYVARRG